MVSQLVKYTSVASAFLSAWILLLPLDNVVITYAPIIAIIALGIYAVFSVIYGVLTFNDCEDAKISLQAEIKEARADLLKRKVIKS